MSWNKAADQELGTYVAGNSPKAAAHFPFLILFSRYAAITYLYLAARTPPSLATELQDKVWTDAWLHAADFLESQASYRVWVLNLARKELALAVNMSLAGFDKHLSNTWSSHASHQPDSTCDMDVGLFHQLRSVTLTLPVDQRKLFRFFTAGWSEESIQQELQIDANRYQKWLASCRQQLNRAYQASEGCLLIADTPTSQMQLVHWMEGYLSSTPLRSLITELAAVCSTADSQEVLALMELDQVLLNRATTVYESGLRVLSRLQLQRLLQRPWLLLTLQAQILEQGGAYWQTEINKRMPAHELQQQQTKIEMRLGPEAVGLLRSKAQAHEPSSANPVIPWEWLRPPMVYWLASVASLVVLSVAALWIGLYWQEQRKAREMTDWANRLQASPLNNTSDYFTALAGYIQEWYHDQPQTADRLRARLAKLAENLNNLEQNQPTAMSEVDRNWLDLSLKSWKQRAERIVLRLDNENELAMAIDEANALVVEMLNALHQRAAFVNR